MSVWLKASTFNHDSSFFRSFSCLTSEPSPPNHGRRRAVMSHSLKIHLKQSVSTLAKLAFWAA